MTPLMHLTNEARCRRTLRGAVVGLLFAAASVQAATVTPVAGGRSAATGQAYHATTNKIYFAEWFAGRLSRLDPVTGTVSTVGVGFVHPQDVVLWPGFDYGLVTTRDGNMWLVSLLSGARWNLATGLGMPHQLVLDHAGATGYTVDFSGGRLWKVHLPTGGKIPVAVGLLNPIGLLMSPDFKTAWVAEPTRVLRIDLTTGIRTVVVGGLVNAFHMAWANDERTAFYLVERDPANRLRRVDIGAGAAVATVIATVPFRPSSVVRSSDPNVVYVASNDVISRVTLADADGPIVTRFGFVPVDSIDAGTGLATTDPTYFYRVKNAAFGGSVHVMLNFPAMRAAGASHYRVEVDDAVARAIWTNHKWEGGRFVAQSVAPTDDGSYTMPLASDLWAIPDLGFVLDTQPLSNGRHRVKVTLYAGAATISNREVAFQVDNAPPVVEIVDIRSDGVAVGACGLITGGGANMTFTVRVVDNEGHLFSYSLTDRWGRDDSNTFRHESYIGTHDAATTWSGPGTFTTGVYTPSCKRCGHSFELQAIGNVTNGYAYIQASTTIDHVAIFLAGEGACG